jgi:hypothetical protein
MQQQGYSAGCTTENLTADASWIVRIARAKHFLAQVATNSKVHVHDSGTFHLL